MSFKRTTSTTVVIPARLQSRQGVEITRPVAGWASPGPTPLTPLPARGPQLALAGLILSTMLLVVLVATAALVALLFYRSDRILPGVRVAGFDLSDKSRAEAVALLQQHWSSQIISLQAGGKSWPVSPAGLGLTLDSAVMVQTAYQQGRSLDTWRAYWRARGQIDLPPLWQFDPIRAEASLSQLAPQLEQPAQDATIRIGEGRAEAVPAVPGRVLDVAATVKALGRQPMQVLAERRLTLVMQPVQPAVSDVSAAVDQANALLGRTLTLQTHDPIRDESTVLTIPPVEWAGWLALELDSGDPSRVAWSVNTDQVQGYLAAQSTALGPERYLKVDEATTRLAEAIRSQQTAVRLRVYHRPGTYAVQAGQTLSSIAYEVGLPYPWIQAANPGLGNNLSPGQVLALPSPDDLLPLPVVEDKRIVISLSQQKMWVYEAGAVKWEWPASSGIASSPTAPGVFQIQSHEQNAYAANWNLWMPHFMGIYRPVPASDFMNGIHGFPSRGGAQLLWTNDLGRRVTYGCILISSENAATLYNWAEAGVVVEIQD
ncbi:MAG: L,D-transpeptidase family protein [Anaerolineales bacterium]|nr:L,D-transpeptidase family protein [Anaerolineales bacterium]